MDVMKVIGAAFFWFMWKTRNSKIFKGGVFKEKEIGENIQFLAFEWVRSRLRLGKLLSWDNWICNPIKVVAICTHLAPRYFF